MMAIGYQIVLCRSKPELLSLDALAAHAGVHPTLVEEFVRFGLIEPAEREGGKLLFEFSVISRLRTICRLRESLGINLAGVAVVLDLLDKYCALQRENEWLRSRL
jgi:DNA-binding transcriptional MerR regulator